MKLALVELRLGGSPAEPGNTVIYDLDVNEAFFGEVEVDRPAVLWELGDFEPHGHDLAVDVELDPATEWLMRCDRIDFPPGSVAYRHTHPGPGIRRLLFGSLTVETGGETQEYGPGDAWFESGPEPVVATASATEETAFVRVMLLPREWEGKRTIQYVDPADEEKPKLQQATIFFDQLISF
jgi:quercetin dioxygenase-like cupin family protein